MTATGTARRTVVRGRSLAWHDAGSGPALLFLHGNPTSGYLWRNVWPPLATGHRCIVPDLLGMGESEGLPGDDPDRYSFFVHSESLDDLLEQVLPPGPVVLVLQDWGSALGFHWARRHPERVAGIAYLEALVTPLEWDDWPAAGRAIFQALRSPAGEDLILARNVFIEKILPASILRTLTADEHAAYRAPFAAAGEGRRVMLAWPRALPIGGEPAAVVAAVRAYSDWLAASPVPKLFINAEPGSILVGRQREVCRRWPNQREVTVPGSHFVQEDSPAAIAAALADWLPAIGHA
jgi:haloalkane dehalogenase